MKRDASEQDPGVGVASQGRSMNPALSLFFLKNELIEVVVSYLFLSF